jgi:hypothetical protein
MKYQDMPDTKPVLVRWSTPTVVASYKPIDRADRVDDWLYQPEVMYALMLLYFIAAGAGPVSIDQLLKLWIG